MKKNIDKPELYKEDLAALSSVIDACYMLIIKPVMYQAKYRLRRHMKKRFIEAEEAICAGEWVDAMVVFLRQPTFDKVFRETYKHAMDESALFYEKTDESTANDIILGLRKVALVYEYITGKDIKTGKVLHRGVVNA